jgi:hypothetical protein
MLLLPDTAIVCEYLLAAIGLADARALAGRVSGFYVSVVDHLHQGLSEHWSLSSLCRIVSAYGILRQDEASLDIDNASLLLRCLRDFNLPRYTAMESEVFNRLLSDYFPGASAGRTYDEALREGIANAGDEAGLWTEGKFPELVLQLDEMLDLSDSIVISGASGVSKSSVWKTLIAARTKSNESVPIICEIIYPWSMSFDELYGSADPISRKWLEGRLANLLQKASNETKHSTIVVFDGLLDSSWSDNLGSLLGKGRCMVSSELNRIDLPADFKFIFESVDLRNSSPSVCAASSIMHIPADGYQRVNILGCWLRTRKHDLFDLKAKEHVYKLVERYVPLCFQVAMGTSAYLSEPILAMRLTKLLDVMLVSRDVVQQPSLLENMFVFCVLWSVGCDMGDRDMRNTFSEFFRKSFRDLAIPSFLSVFDYWFNISSGSFESWKQYPGFKEFHYDGSRLSQVFLPSLESTVVAHFAERLLLTGYSVAIGGEPGCGKSSLALQILSGDVNARLRVNHCIMSHLTTVRDVSGILLVPAIDYLPSRQFVFFIDDMEVSGTIQVSEYLRSHLENDANVARQTALYCTYLVSSTPPAQIMRHLFPIAYHPSSSSMGSVLLGFLQSHISAGGFTVEYKNIAKSMIKGSLQVLENMLAQYRPSPRTQHYAFSQRCLFESYLGIHYCTYSICDEPTKLVEFWLHELNRTYCDVLIDEHKDRYSKMTFDVVKKEFSQFYMSKYFPSPVSPAESLLFCHFSGAARYVDPASLTYDLVVDWYVKFRATDVTAFTFYAIIGKHRNPRCMNFWEHMTVLSQ